ncbi:MAG: sulfurtransferase [Woeseiaceae bacterium]
MTERSNLIDTGDLAACLESPDVRIVDCRFDLGDANAGRRAYEEGHIRGAVFADLDVDLASPIRPDTGRHPLPDVDGFAATLGRMGIDERSDVIVYDAGPGALAARAWWLLRWLGHDKVRLLNGGFQQWLKDGNAIDAGDQRATPRKFSARPRSDRIITTAELADSSHSIETMNLVDARDTARFKGDEEPIDTVAGHIPGALNVPFPESLDDNGLWRTPEELESLWAAVLGEDRHTAWISMCGSGVTACHLAISALEAGYREPRLYVGSWSEWIRDPTRAIGRGEGRKRGSWAADMA